MRVLVVVNKANANTLDASLLLSTYLSSQGIDCLMLDSMGAACLRQSRWRRARSTSVLANSDRSGYRAGRRRHHSQDGSFRVGHRRADHGHQLRTIWVFLPTRASPGVIAVVAAALSGDVVAERRANLRIDVVCEGDEEENLLDGDRLAQPVDGEFRSYFALNELAVARGASGRIVDFSVELSGRSCGVHARRWRGGVDGYGIDGLCALGRGAFGGSGISRSRGGSARTSHIAFSRDRNRTARRRRDRAGRRGESVRGCAVRRRRSARIRPACCTRDCAQGRSTHYAFYAINRKVSTPRHRGCSSRKDRARWRPVLALSRARAGSPQVRKTPAVPIEGRDALIGPSVWADER